MQGLDEDVKSHRVFNFHKSTVHTAIEIVGAAGYTHASQVTANDVMRRVDQQRVQSLAEIYYREGLPTKFS